MSSPYNLRDAEEQATVVAVLSILRPEHAARSAFATGLDTIRLTHLAADRPELVESLKDAFLAGYNRMLQRSGAHFRP